jgi:hypothetical protein
MLQGSADSTQHPLATLQLNPPGDHGIILRGSETASGLFAQPFPEAGQSFVTVPGHSGITAGDLIRLRSNDDAQRITSAWAGGSAGQVITVAAVSGDTLYLDGLIRRSYLEAPEIMRINPVRNAHIHCLGLERMNETTQQTANILIEYATDCSIRGLRSTKCNFAHVAVRYSSHIVAEDCAMYDAFSHGSGGKAYGVVLEFATSECLVHRNTFDHLRHSVLLQAGANGNVIAYNYSSDPYWTGVSLPSDAAGDLVLHGNYPYLNLFEGNVAQNLVIDDSHGINGPYNTFFRNRLNLYGIFMNNNPPSDSQNFIANHITNTSGPFTGLYLLSGSDHFASGNIRLGTVVPSGTTDPPEASLFGYAFNSYYTGLSLIPPVQPASFSTSQPVTEAQYRTEVLAIPSACGELSYEEVLFTEESAGRPDGLMAWPNPCRGLVHFDCNRAVCGQIDVYDLTGHRVAVADPGTALNTESLRPGVYLVVCRIGGSATRLIRLP